MHSTTSQMSTRDRIGAILRVTSGNFLEQFDFFLFGFYATYIAHTFFPASSEFASLMMTFAVFGAGFLMRPIGAIVLGAYIDKVGRRKGLIVTLSIMATGTFLIVLIPSYQTIGLWAPLLVLIGRLLQGFSAGAELGGVSVYLAEIATPGRKGFYTSWQSGSQQVAIMVAAAMGFSLNAVLEPSAISDWGWRIPFLFGCLTGLRKSDIKQLTWQQIQPYTNGKMFVTTRMQKTKQIVHNPISDEAYRLLGERHDGLIFDGFKDKMLQGPLKRWLLAAGITKKITFHCTRHSFGSLHVEMGTDMTVIQACLGHKNITTTQIYSKMAAQQMCEVVDKITLKRKEV